MAEVSPSSTLATSWSRLEPRLGYFSSGFSGSVGRVSSLAVAGPLTSLPPNSALSTLAECLTSDSDGADDQVIDIGFSRGRRLKRGVCSLQVRLNRAWGRGPGPDQSRGHAAQDDQGRSYSNRNSESSDSHNVTFQNRVADRAPKPVFPIWLKQVMRTGIGGTRWVTAKRPLFDSNSIPKSGWSSMVPPSPPTPE